MEGKTFQEVIEGRRSHRKFADKAVSDEEAKKILDAALMAPAGKRANAWEFIVITDKGQAKALSECKPFGSAFVAEAPISIVVCADTSKTDVWVEDCSIAAIYMQLTAESLGLGSCWSQIRQRASREEGKTACGYVKELLGIPGNYEVECIISIGHKVEEKRPFDPNRLQREKIHWGRF